MLGLLLNIIAEILKWVFAPIGYFYGVFASLYKGEFSKYNRQLAVVKDKYGNVNLQYILNEYFITKDGHKFGNADETVSYVLGKNKEMNTLKDAGKLLSTVLNFFDKNHVEKAVINHEQN